MATVTQYWAPSEQTYDIWQAYGTTVQWTWNLGDDTYFWTFAVRPWTWNSSVYLESPIGAIESVEPQAYMVGDDMVFEQQTVLTVRVEQTDPNPPPQSRYTGSFLRFTAIKVQEP